jgi:hypothetical protein
MNTNADVLDAHYRAYAAADVEGLVATLAPDFVCASLNGPAIASGREAAAKLYAATIRRWPLERTRTLGRMEVGNVIILHELSQSAGDQPVTGNLLSIYTFQDGLIARVDLTPDAGGDLHAAERGAPVAEGQLVAYNSQDLDAHVGWFADGVVVSDLNQTPNLSGAAAYRERMGGVFGQFPQNRVELLGRLACGTVVCDHEKVMRSPDAAPFEVIAIYTLNGDRIARVDFVR